MEYKVGDIVRVHKIDNNADYYHDKDMIVIGYETYSSIVWEGEILIVDHNFGDGNTIHPERIYLVKSARQRKLEKLNGL